MGNSTSNITDGDRRQPRVQRQRRHRRRAGQRGGYRGNTVSLGAALSAGNIVQTGGTLTISGSNTGSGTRTPTNCASPSETSTYTLSGGMLSVPNGITYAPWDGSAVFTISGGTANLRELSFEDSATDTAAGTLGISGGGALYLGAGGMVKVAATPSISVNNGTLVRMPPGRRRCR